MFGPSQVAVHNGLTLTAHRNTNQYAKSYPWMSGVVTTEGKLSLPSTGWDVQVKAKMPDMTSGMWPAIWFMPDTPTSTVPEIDLFEGGWLGSDPNEIMHSDYGGSATQYSGYRDIVYNTGSDLTAGYHVYSIQYIPNVSVKYFFDGKLTFEQLDWITLSVVRARTSYSWGCRWRRSGHRGGIPWRRTPHGLQP